MFGLHASIQNYLFVLEILIILTLFFVSKKSGVVKKIFITVSILVNLVYLVWRTVYTLPLSFGVVSVIFGVLLVLAEWMGFGQSFVFKMLFWNPYKNEEWPPESFIIEPTVDVFIATYNESMKILKKTMVACLNLDYPKDCLNIYLCDDGRRDEAKALCEELGVHYLTRADNKHAKAGNVNSALKQTNGEFVLLLDADMVPKSYFLKKTIGYFVNPNLGFVQTPQVFYNPDPYQYNLKKYKQIPNEQDLFMLDIQGGRDNFNAVLHVGTNAIFRRKAIEDIGGIPTGTITEDMATGMLIQAKGYETKFVKETLCTGLSVESFSDLVVQRERWCRGNIQVVKKWNPLKIKGLSFMQRLIYVDGFLYWFAGAQKLIFILSPLIYLVFGFVILNTTAYNLLFFWVPSFLATTLSYRSLVSKNRTISWSHIYETATAPFLALAALTEQIFSRPITFRVTPKGINSLNTSISVRYSLPHFVLLLLTILGWAFAVQGLRSGLPAIIDSTVINLGWSIYNGVAIVISIFVCIEKPRKRISERLGADETIVLSSDEAAFCRILDISEAGAKIECTNIGRDLAIAERVELKNTKLGNLGGEIVWKQDEEGRKSFGIKFNDMSNDEYSKVIKYMSDSSKGYHEDK
ncbi:MAG: glycosyltransferase [Clostridia bacterium]|nr:glycosyltransferase [Clostridia bacterium]